MEVVRRHFCDFKTISSFIAIILVIVLDGNIAIETIVVMTIIVLFFYALKREWSRKKWTAVLILCISLINIYYQLTEYFPYWLHNSAAYNNQFGFSYTQACYVYNVGNADALLCSILNGKNISVYGNCQIYRNYFKLYSERILTFDNSKNVDFLKEKKESFLNLGTMSICNALDCFEDNEVDKLKEIRDNMHPELYFSSDKVLEDECVIAIDSGHSIYVMSKAQWEQVENE